VKGLGIAGAIRFRCNSDVADGIGEVSSSVQQSVDPDGDDCDLPSLRVWFGVATSDLDKMSP
jgi:hypothetical protein